MANSLNQPQIDWAPENRLSVALRYDCGGMLAAMPNFPAVLVIGPPSAYGVKLMAFAVESYRVPDASSSDQWAISPVAMEP